MTKKETIQTYISKDKEIYAEARKYWEDVSWNYYVCVFEKGFFGSYGSPEEIYPRDYPITSHYYFENKEDSAVEFAKKIIDEYNRGRS